MSGKKKHHEEEENQERWLLTYADMITLLVAFFMMMYSMSVLNLEKFKQAAIGIRSGFNGPVMEGKESGDSLVDKGAKEKILPPLALPLPPPAVKESEQESEQEGARRRRPGKPNATKPSPAQQRAARVQALTERINRSLKGIAGGRAAAVIPETKGVAIELIGDTIFFPAESDRLSDEARSVLRAVADVVKTLPNEISVEGHTSRFVPQEGAPFTNSWELSTARGTAVVKFLLAIGGINPQKISVTGYGHYRPVKPHGNASASPSNDLVRIFIYQD